MVAMLVGRVIGHILKIETQMILAKFGYIWLSCLRGYCLVKVNGEQTMMKDRPQEMRKSY